MILPPLVASVEGVELLFTPSGRREHAHEVVDLAIVDRGAVSDDLDAEAVEHRQSALAEDAVELLASASHEFVRPQIQHARAGPGRPAHAAPRAALSRATGASLGPPASQRCVAANARAVQLIDCGHR